MKKTSAIIGVVLTLAVSTVSAELVQQFKNPAFSGIGFSSHVLTIDSIEKSRRDAIEADKAVNEFRASGFRGPVYFMPCGGVESLYNLNAKNVAIEAMNRGYRYSDRLQVPLFKNEWGT